MSLTQALQAILRRWWIPVLVAVLAVVAVFALSPTSSRSVPQYTAKSILVFNTSVNETTSGSSLNLDQASLETTVGPVPALAAQILHYPGNPTVLASQISVSDNTGVGTLTLQSTGTDGKRAADIANAFATALNQQLTNTRVADYQSQVTSINNRLNDLQGQINQYNGLKDPVSVAKLGGAEDQYRLAYDQFQQLAAQGQPGPTFNVLQTAVPVPSGGVHPPRSRLAKSFVGGVVGLLIGCGIVVGLELIRPRIRTRPEAEQDFSAVVLAEIPLLRHSQRTAGARSVWHGSGRPATNHRTTAFREAHRMLRSALALMVSPDPNRTGEKQPRVILVTSAGAGEGKSTTVANLAVALADSGQRVLVLNADFRAPQVHMAFGLDPGPGMTDVMSSAALDESGRGPIRLADLVQPTSVPGVSLVHAGSRVDGPAELIASRGAHLLEEARGLADVVLLDTAPLLMVSDTSELLLAVDAVLLVAWIGSTTRAHARRAAEMLDRTGVPVLGVTLVGLRGRTAQYYGYGSTSGWGGRIRRLVAGLEGGLSTQEPLPVAPLPVGSPDAPFASPDAPGSPPQSDPDGGEQVANGRSGGSDLPPRPVTASSPLTVPSTTARPSAEVGTRRFRPPPPSRPPRQASAPQSPARQAREPRAASPAAPSGPDADPPGPARHPRSAGGTTLWRLLDEPLLTGAVVLAAAVGAALAGCHPTGTPVVDPLYTAVFAATVTLAASRAARPALLILSAVAVVMSRGALVLPAAAALVAAFGSVYLRRTYRVWAALVGALAVQAVVRWPTVGFHGLTALVAVAAVIPCVVSAYGHTPDRVRRFVRRAAIAVPGAAIVVSVPIAAAALLAHRDVSAGITATTGALGAVSDGTTASGTQQLRVASADFAAATRRTGAWWTLGGRLVPVVAQQRQVLARATAVARDVTAAVGNEADQAKGNTIAYSGGGVDLTKVAALVHPLGVIDSRLASAVNQLASVRSGWVVGPLQSRFGVLDADIAKAHSGAQIASQVVRAAPSIFGGEGTRHYFVAFMTPAESRGLGGFTGAYGELTVDQGHVTLTRSGDISDLNNVPAGTRHITAPADYVARYGPFQPQDFFQDLTYSPDLPTVSQVIAEMYPQSGGDQIDGVLALDPEALAALLNFTGPIDIANVGVVNASNAADVLLKGQYATIPAPTQQTARHDYLQDALGVAFQKLTSGSLPGPQTLSATLDPAVRQGRLLFWSLHPSDQPVLRRLGLDGSFPSARGKDLLALTTQNAANNKLDAYLQRSIDDHVTYDPGNGRVGATVKITLHNEAPSAGLASDVLGSYSGSGLPPGTNRTWLSLYTPLTLTAANIDGGPLPLPITSTPELGVHAYSVYVNLPPGGTVTLLVGLRGQVKAGSTYQLTLHQQPLVLPDDVSVHVTGPNLTGSGSWSPSRAANQSRLFRFAT